MALDKVALWNRALSLAQESATVTDPNENKKLPNLCRLWYDQARRRVLQSSRWPCATTYTRLALLAERDFSGDWQAEQGAPGYAFFYALPEDLLLPQYLSTYNIFERLFINGKQGIATNQEQAVLRYTFDQTDVATWDEGLVTAVVTYHASLMARNINGKLGLSDRLQREAEDALLSGSTDIANESEVMYEALPQNIQARGYLGAPSVDRYFYPVKDLAGKMQ